MERCPRGACAYETTSDHVGCRGAGRRQCVGVGRPRSAGIRPRAVAPGAGASRRDRLPARAHPGLLRAGDRAGRRLHRARSGEHEGRRAHRPSRSQHHRHHRRRRPPRVRRPQEAQDHRRRHRRGLVRRRLHAQGDQDPPGDPAAAVPGPAVQRRLPGADLRRGARPGQGGALEPRPRGRRVSGDQASDLPPERRPAARAQARERAAARRLEPGLGARSSSSRSKSPTSRS